MRNVHYTSFLTLCSEMQLLWEIRHICQVERSFQPAAPSLWRRSDILLTHSQPLLYLLYFKHPTSLCQVRNFRKLL